MKKYKITVNIKVDKNKVCKGLLADRRAIHIRFQNVEHSLIIVHP